MRYAFGPFTLDTSTLELSREDELVSIEPQVFELLVFLLENRERVHSKDDLIKAIWDGRIVSDAAISSRIKLVRRAVDDDGSKQAVIKTVHGKGFRFIAEVNEVEATPNAKLPEIFQTTAIEKNRRFLVPAILAAVVVLSIVLLFQLFAESNRSHEARIAVLPVSNQTGEPDLDWVELGLMSLVSHELSDRSELSLVEDSTIVTLSKRFPSLAEDRFAPGEEMSQALQVGHGASHVLLARLIGSADNLSIEYRMLNPRGETELSRISGQEPTRLAKEMGRQIITSLPRSGEQRLDLQTNKFDDEYVAETFARGRELQLKGYGNESADLFRVASTAAPENREIRFELAKSLRMAGEFDQAEALLRALITQSSELQDREMEAATLVGLGINEMRQRNDVSAVEHYETALSVLTCCDKPELRAKALTNIGVVQRRLGNLPAAEDALGRALVEFQKAGLASPPGSLLNSMGNLKTLQRDIATANTYYERSLEYNRLVGDRRSEAVNLHNLGANALTIASYDRAHILLNDALHIRREIRDLQGQMSSLSVLAQLALKSGNATKAIHYADEMTTLALEEDDQYLFARSKELAAHIDMVLGDWNSAMAHSQTAQSTYMTLDRERNAQRERIRQATIKGLSGSTKDKSVVEDVLSWAIKEDQQGTQLHAYEALTMLCLLEGDISGALEGIDSAVELSADMQLNAVNGRLSARQGLVRLLLGDEEGAVSALGRAKIGNPQHQETIFLDGILILRAGNPKAAASLIETAKLHAGDNWHLTARLFHSLNKASRAPS